MSKQEIKKFAKKSYSEVEIISETSTSIKLKCDSEVNDFLLDNQVCIQFNSLKSYKCECLASDLKAYNQHLKWLGNMKWTTSDNSKIYQITLHQEDYTVSISTNSSDLALLK